jgi:alkanesulfonate monooxygenase SsuD/methylene tetrahydromethanopterin reductase-like flavin-dependent oxidoreductase (luciferase family)
MFLNYETDVNYFCCADLGRHQPTSLRLSVLDQSPIPEGSSAPEALAATLQLAKLADRLGYQRYWLAEHHNTVGLGSSPESLRVLHALYPGRIDLGVGRAPGSDRLTAAVLATDTDRQVRRAVA